MNKFALTTTLALALAAQAHAGHQIQTIQLPSAFPVSPLALPSSIPGNDSLKLPTFVDVTEQVRLPGVKGLPKIAPTLPNAPKPLITIPGLPVSKLPGVKLPVVSRDQVVTVKSFAAFAKLEPVKSGSEAAETEKARESLGRAFDGSAQDEEPSEVRHTLPENDLLNEIGIR
jgi:hypothetical protein